jgi:hypothetical protein
MKYEVRFLSKTNQGVIDSAVFDTDDDPHSFVNCEYEFLVALYDYEIDELEEEQ